MTSMSGIKVDPSVAKLWKDIQLNKVHKFAGFKLSDDNKSVVIDEDLKGKKVQTASKEEDEEYFNEMKSRLTKEEPRFLVYDFGFKLPDGRDCKKAAFIYWCCNECKVHKKMIYTSTKDTVKKVLTGVMGQSFEIDDLQDLDYNEITKDVVKKL